MAYGSRYIPPAAQAAAPAPAPAADPPASNTVKGAPLLWRGDGNFDIGQETEGGGHNFTGNNIVNVTNMIKAQLVQAAKETNYELKRLAIQKKQHELMKKIAQSSTTPNEFEDRCYDEPSLTLEETPPFDGLGNPKYNTPESIRAEIAKWLSVINADIAAREAVKKQIGELGGPVPLSPTEESTGPSEIDKVKNKISEIEQGVDPDLPGKVDALDERVTEAEEHLVPEPGTPPTAEAVPGAWPKEMPEFPEFPPGTGGITLSSIIAHVSMIREYIRHKGEYEDAKQFNMAWCLEMIRVCLNELKAAKAPGTQTDNFKNNLEGLSDGTFALEERGVFSD